MKKEDVISSVSPLDWRQVGSRATCSPAPSNTDDDVIVLVDDAHEAVHTLMLHGFSAEGDPEKYQGCGDDFLSMRLDDLNILVTSDIEFFRKFILASSVAKRFNLMNKSDRIALFQAILYQEASCDMEII